LKGPAPRSVLALDVGRKRIGLAGCDPLGLTVTPLPAELPLALVNEYASSWSAAERHGLHGDRSGALDSAAAALLLEQWLQEGPEPAPVHAQAPSIGSGADAQAS